LQVTDSEVTPADVIDAEVVPFTEAEIARYPALRLETGVGEAYDRAESADELLEELPDAVGLKEYLGRPITIHGASLRIGEADGKQTLYVMLDATDDSTGDRMAMSTGAGAVMRQVNRAAQIGAFPLTCMPYEVDLGKGRGTKSNPIHLGKVDLV
jgi:hypothetical protein